MGSMLLPAPPSADTGLTVTARTLHWWPIWRRLGCSRRWPGSIRLAWSWSRPSASAGLVEARVRTAEGGPCTAPADESGRPRAVPCDGWMPGVRRRRYAAQAPLASPCTKEELVAAWVD